MVSLIDCYFGTLIVLKNINLFILVSHFSSSEEISNIYNFLQNKKFKTVFNLFKSIKYTSLSNSAGILNNKKLPIYGKGRNSREWIFVDDHCEALIKIYKSGKLGEFYNIGSNKNLNNIQVTKELLINSKKIIKIGKKVKIVFVKDRPGHDLRYALNSNKIKKELGWRPKTNFKKGIKLTIDWYLKNKNYYKSLSKKDITKRLGKK